MSQLATIGDHSDKGLLAVSCHSGANHLRSRAFCHRLQVSSTKLPAPAGMEGKRWPEWRAIRREGRMGARLTHRVLFSWRSCEIAIMGRSCGVGAAVRHRTSAPGVALPCFQTKTGERRSGGVCRVQGKPQFLAALVSRRVDGVRSLGALRSFVLRGYLNATLSGDIRSLRNNGRAVGTDVESAARSGCCRGVG
jgi:hypothetical protein